MSTHAAARRPARKNTRRTSRSRLVLLAPLGLALAVAAVLIGVSLATSPSSGRPDTSHLQYLSDVRSSLAGLPSHGNTIGYADAPAVIREYADLRCPACREWDAGVAPDVIRTLVWTHQARLVFETWPILGDNSVYAARAAYAARQQNALWRYAQMTYVNQGDEHVDWFDRGFARAVAAAAGLDLARFDRDLNDTAASDHAIQAVDQVARRAGFSGTPTIVVQGPGGKVSFGTSGVPDLGQLRAAVAKVRVAA